MWDFSCKSTPARTILLRIEASVQQGGAPAAEVTPDCRIEAIILNSQVGRVDRFSLLHTLAQFAGDSVSGPLLLSYARWRVCSGLHSGVDYGGRRPGANVLVRIEPRRTEGVFPGTEQSDAPFA